MIHCWLHDAFPHGELKVNKSESPDRHAILAEAGKPQNGPPSGTAQQLQVIAQESALVGSNVQLHQVSLNEWQGGDPCSQFQEPNLTMTH